MRTLRKAIIKVDYRCNNSCLFCHSSDCKGIQPLSTAEAILRIDEALAIGAQQVLFSGGEPTIRPDLIDLAQACTKRNLPFGLVTNGRMLSYQPLARRLLKSGLSYVYLSLHGPQEAHDRTTRAPGSFQQSMAALMALDSQQQVEVHANVVVHSNNLGHLETVIDLLAPLTRCRIKFSLVEPKGRALERTELIPHPGDAAAAVSRAIDYGRSIGLPSGRFGVDGFPHCLDSRFSRLQDDMFTHQIFAIREVEEGRFFPIDYLNMRRPRQCLGCLIGEECRGCFSPYFDLFGDGFVTPVKGGKPNSYNYYRPTTTGTFPSDVTSRKDASTGSDPRMLLVEHDSERALCYTDTGDFSHDELIKTRDLLGQIYLQIDDKPFVTDFPTQLRKLVPLEHPGHGGESSPVWRVCGSNTFEVADKVIADLIGRVEGELLDVGCGQWRYPEILDSLLKCGKVRYTGVDPHPDPGLKILASKGAITLLENTIEDCRFAPEQFDFILVLRSHNHLLDLWAAYSTIFSALKWGGTLIVADNVPFGLVRWKIDPSAVPALSQNQTVPPEHLRNHDHNDLLAFLSRFPLLKLSVQPVSKDTANQWVVVLKKGWRG